MGRFDDLYEKRLIDIISNGVSNEGENVRTVWKDGEPAYTKAVWHRVFRIQPEDGFPLLTPKFVAVKSLSAEILWIMQKASNVVSLANELGSKVWNEWENEEGTIGTAYGYQIRNNTYMSKSEHISEESWKAIGKEYPIVKEGEDNVVHLNQIDYVIHQLIDNPSSRQTLTTLLNPKEKHKMELPPCVWTSHWEVLGGKLQLAVTARSSDTFLGLPFNVAQYALLHRLIAHVTGHPLGDFVFTTEDTHLYDRHIPIAMEYLNRDKHPSPEFWLDETVESFQEFEYNNNFGWKDYAPGVGNEGRLSAPVAISKKELDRLRQTE